MDREELALEMTKLTMQNFAQVSPNRLVKCEEVVEVFQKYLAKIDEIKK